MNASQGTYPYKFDGRQYTMRDHFKPLTFEQYQRRWQRKVPRSVTSTAAKHAKAAADRAGTPITWQEARHRADSWNELCGRGR